MVFEVLAETIKEISGELFNNINDFFSLVMIIIYVIIFFVLQYYIIKFYVYLGTKIYDGLVYFKLIKPFTSIREKFNFNKNNTQE